MRSCFPDFTVPKRKSAGVHMVEAKSMSEAMTAAESEDHAQVQEGSRTSNCSWRSILRKILPLPKNALKRRMSPTSLRCLGRRSVRNGLVWSNRGSSPKQLTLVVLFESKLRSWRRELGVTNAKKVGHRPMLQARLLMLQVVFKTCQRNISFALPSSTSRWPCWIICLRSLPRTRQPGDVGLFTWVCSSGLRMWQNNCRNQRAEVLPWAVVQGWCLSAFDCRLVMRRTSLGTAMVLVRSQLR